MTGVLVSRPENRLHVAASDVAFVGGDAADRNRGIAGRGRCQVVSAVRISDACSWSTQKMMVLGNRSVS